tara:strand:+ start:447327 stop:448313 length:987 start_codon:yes stop_codon:yes gene_type:complete
MLKVQPNNAQSATQTTAEYSASSWLSDAGPVALTLSFLLHFAVVFIMTAGLPFMPDHPSIEMDDIVAVEFVEIAEKTESTREHSRAKDENEQTRAKNVKPEAKPEIDESLSKPKPKSAPTVDAKSQPLTVNSEKNKVETAPPPPADSVPMPEEADKEKPSLAPTKPKKPNKRPKKPEEKKAEVAKEERSFDSVLKNLQITENSNVAEEEGDNAQSAAPKTPTLGQRITMSELDALRSQLAQCWNVLAGANFDQALVVYIKLYMNPDRTIRRYEVKDKLRYSTDSFFRAAADSATRAVTNPSCSPLNLPAGKYDQWKEMTIKFDPSEML